MTQRGDEPSWEASLSSSGGEGQGRGGRLLARRYLPLREIANSTALGQRLLRNSDPMSNDNSGTDAIELFKQAMCDNDAALMARVLEENPELKARINDPVGPFDSPA